jgi:hypothetical protein
MSALRLSVLFALTFALAIPGIAAAQEEAAAAPAAPRGRGSRLHGDLVMLGRAAQALSRARFAALDG